MKYANEIPEKAESLISTFHTRNPIQLAEAMGITIIRADDLKTLKGMYFTGNGKRFIVLNDNLEPDLMNIVCAHELGHDQLHRAFAGACTLKETMVFDPSNRLEYEANIFAASILIDDDEMLEYIYDYGYGADQIAQAMHTDVNLVALKVKELSAKGYDLHRLETKADFLK